jgi:hypothetical protein
VEFVALVLAADAALADAGISHAFGGALALGFIAAPRGTVDIDVNVFISFDELDRVSGAFGPLGYTKTEGSGPPIAGVRFVHPSDPFPIDVFPAIDPRYDEVERRVVRHRFGPRKKALPFLSPEDLCVFKLSFGRPQDWVDLAAVARAQPSLDVGYIEEQLIGLRGPTMYPRIARLRGLFP